MDKTNQNMRSMMELMVEMNKNVQRSNALMTVMNEKLGIMTKVMEKIPGLKP
jgi:hypothetical protein